MNAVDVMQIDAGSILSTSAKFGDVLTTFSPKQVQLQNLALRQNNHLQFTSDLDQWRLVWCQANPELHTFNQRIELKTHDLALSFYFNVIPWSVLPWMQDASLPPELLQAALCQAAAPWIEAVESRLGLLLQARIDLDQPANAPSTHVIGFALVGSDGLIHDQGLLHLQAPTNIEHSLFKPSQRLILDDACQKIPCPVLLELGEQVLTKAELAELEIGDALLLEPVSSTQPGHSAPQQTAAQPGRAGDAPHIVRLRPLATRHPAWLGEIHAGHFNFSQKESPMPERSIPLGNEPENLHQVENVPITLTFAVGQQVVSFGDLAGFKPGYTLPLAAEFDKGAIDIMANGMRIGRGELITVGERLAVCIREWQE